MNLDETIKYYENLAETNKNNIVPKENYQNMPWIDESNEHYKKMALRYSQISEWLKELQYLRNAIAKGKPLTPNVLADLLMEERIRGKLDSNITFEKDIIDDVKCRLTVSIIDHRPCYCGAELREVWRESEENK